MMVSKVCSLIVLFIFATITITMAHASTQTQISLTSVGNSKIDLAWDDKDRIIRTWAEFSNFHTEDGSFNMKIIQTETGKIISESKINVMTTSSDNSINFNSFMLYLVDAKDICQNGEIDENETVLQDCDPQTGNYEMKVSTNDGSATQSIIFSVIDSRI